MDNQPHVRFVNSHTECVGCRDDAQFPIGKTILNVFLGIRREPGVKKVSRYILILKKLYNLFGVTARCTVNDGAAGRLLRKVCR